MKSNSSPSKKLSKGKQNVVSAASPKEFVVKQKKALKGDSRSGGAIATGTKQMVTPSKASKPAEPRPPNHVLLQGHEEEVTTERDMTEDPFEEDEDDNSTCDPIVESLLQQDPLEEEEQNGGIYPSEQEDAAIVEMLLNEEDTDSEDHQHVVGVLNNTESFSFTSSFDPEEKVVPDVTTTIGDNPPFIEYLEFAQDSSLDHALNKNDNDLSSLDESATIEEQESSYYEEISVSSDDKEDTRSRASSVVLEDEDTKYTYETLEDADLYSFCTYYSSVYESEQIHYFTDAKRPQGSGSDKNDDIDDNSSSFSSEDSEWEHNFVYPKTIPSPSNTYKIVSLSFLDFDKTIPSGVILRTFEESWRMVKPNGGILYVVDFDGDVVQKHPRIRQTLRKLPNTQKTKYEEHENEVCRILDNNGFGADGNISFQGRRVTRWIGVKR